MPGRGYKGTNDYRYGFNGKEDDKETGWQDYGMRMYNPKLSRFFSVDPITDEYPELTPYQFASNSPIDGVDRDGLEWAGVMFGSSQTPMIRPVPQTAIEQLVKPTTEIGKFTEIGSEVSKTTKFSKETIANFQRGNKIEAEQLAKNGLDKNTKPFEVDLLQQGKDAVKTIPDALKNGGKSTVEIKNVKQQSFTRQLQAQKKLPNDNGFKPELIINKDASLSKPLQNAGFDIKFYTPSPISIPKDNLISAPAFDKNKVPLKQNESSNPCSGNPNCL